MVDRDGEQTPRLAHPGQPQLAGPAEARIWYEKELTRRRAENPDSPAVGDVLAGLGLVARNEGNLEEAARLALEVRAHYERTLVPDHPRIASAIDH